MTKKLRQALTEQKHSKEPIKYKIYGTLGIPLGGHQVVEVSTRPQYVYVRLRTNQSEVIQAFNNSVAPSYGLPVIVAREGNRYIILEVDTVRYANNWNNSATFLPSHGDTHSFNDNGGGGDMVWVYSKQFMPMLVYPTGTYGGSSVFISPHMMLDTYNQWHYVGNTGTPNLLQYAPSGTQALMVLVYMDRNTGNPGYLVGSGSLFSNILSSSFEIAPFIPSPQPNQIPLAAIKVSTGTSTINWNYIYDVRQFNQFLSTGSASGGGGGGGSSLGFAGLYNGVPLGTGTSMNVRGNNVVFSISGTTFDLFITGSTGGGTVNPPVTGTFVAQNQGVTLGSVTTLNATAPLFINVSGSVAQILVSGTNSTYMRVGQPTSLSSVTGQYWVVPDRVYATGSLALFNQGHDLIPGIDYLEQYAVSGTFQYISTPPTGTYNLTIYGVPATGGDGSSSSTLPFRTIDNPTDPSWAGNLGFDQEFEATSSTPPVGMAWTNQGGSTYDENFGNGTIYRASQAGDNNYLITESISGAPSTWLMTAKFTIVGAGGNFIDGGLVLRESSSGKFMNFILRNFNTPAVFKWTNPTTFAATVATISVPVSTEYYLRIRKNSSSSFDFEFSQDGKTWRSTQSAYDVGAFITPNEVGFSLLNSAGDNGGVSCYWIRIR